MTDDHDHRPGSTGDPGDEALRARLRAADPAASLPPADPGRVEALLEATMSHPPDTEDHPGGRTRSHPGGGTARRWVPALAAAAVLVVAGVSATLALSGDETPPAASGGVGDPSPGAPASPGGGSEPDGSDGSGELSVLALEPAGAAAARCRVVTPEALAGMETAFAGTVTDAGPDAGDGAGADTVTFTVDRWFTGGDADLVEVADPAALGALVEGSPDFAPGERYLVTAFEGQVTGCGFSAPYSPRLESLFEQAWS